MNTIDNMYRSFIVFKLICKCTKTIFLSFLNENNNTTQHVYVMIYVNINQYHIL